VRRLNSTQGLAAFGGATDIVPQVQNEQSNLLTCFCHLCNGTRKWTQATIDRHYNLEKMRANLMAIPSLSQESCQTSADAEGLPSNEEDLSNTVASISSPLQAPRLECEPLSLHDAIVTQIIDLQLRLHKSHMSVESQGEIMQAFFGSFKLKIGPT